MDLSEHLRTHATHAGPPTADSQSSTLPASAPRSRCHLACSVRGQDDGVNRVSLLARLIGARFHLTSVVPVLVLLVVFKLSVSDGGRHAPTLTLAETAIYLLVSTLAATGTLEVSRLGVAMLVATGAAAFSTVWSVQLDASVRALLMWLMYSGMLVATASTLRTPAAARRLVDGTVVVAGWLCLIGLFVFWGAGDSGLRWSSTFYWPNPFAAFLLLVLPVELSRCVHAPAARDALAHGALSVLLAGSLVLTYSRGAWASLLIVAPLAAFTLRVTPWTRAAFRLVLIGLATGVAVVVLTRGPGTPLFEGGVTGRATSISDAADYSLGGHLHFWRAGLAIFADHPVTGTGPGTFGTVHAAYQRDVRYYARDAHSLYVQTAAEQGTAGLVALAVLLGVLATAWISALRASRRTDSYPLVVGIGLGLAAFFVHNGVDMDWMFPANPAMAMLMAGVLAWFAKDGVAGHEPGRPVMRPWQRLAIVGALLVATALTQMAHLADRQFVSAQELARAGRWAEAADWYAQAVRWDPFSPRILAAQAAALRQLTPPRHGAAEAALRRAMVVDRMSASPRIQLASLLMDRPARGPAALAEAEGLLKEALRLDPWNRPEAYRMLAGMYLRQGRGEDAERLYRQVVPQYLGKGLGRPTLLYLFLWPEVTGLVLDAADLVARRHETALAVSWLQAVLAEDPGATAVTRRLHELTGEGLRR